MLDVVLFFSGMVTLWLYSAREYSREEIWKMIFELSCTIDLIEKRFSTLKNKNPFFLDLLKDSKQKFNHLEKEFANEQFSFNFKKHKNTLKHLKKVAKNFEELPVLLPRKVP